MELKEKLGALFADEKLLKVALTHRSFSNEQKENYEHNERLEFLGDAVLGLLIAEYLYTTYPDMPEGEMSFLRSRLIEAASCIRFVKKLDIEDRLLLGKGEKLNVGKGRDSILADLFEAIIGALYLSGGLEKTRDFLFSHFDEEIQKTIDTPLHNWKALLQDHCQKKAHKTPTYEVIEETGPAHKKTFVVEVYLGDKPLGQGKGANKKKAEQQAAKVALEGLDGNEN
jgi:ribonuclease-3